jgi:hypothetical protein
MDKIVSRDRNSVPLERELETFRGMKADLLKTYEGKYALIKADQFVGAFDGPDNGFHEGVRRFGKEEFLVKRISESEENYSSQMVIFGLMNVRV